MSRVRLVHWNEAEAKERAKLLRAAGFEAAFQLPAGPTFLRELRERPYAAVVIDLSRLPSHGREIAMGIRCTKATRRIPLVFLGGDAEKVERIRALLPDATYTEWSRVRTALRHAIAHPPAAPVTPSSVLAAYAGTPLVKKLGIKPKSVVALVGAPAGFRKTLGALPSGAKLRASTSGGCDLALWFTRTRREIERGVRPLATRTGAAPLWILWPKKAGPRPVSAAAGLPRPPAAWRSTGVSTSRAGSARGKAAARHSDLTQQIVREVAMARGLVDYKICAVDDTWSGLLFRRKRT
ncbi:MAG: hypothetical protein ACRD5G_04705 [Candidatus Acidiferrales bacterium]